MIYIISVVIEIILFLCIKIKKNKKKTKVFLFVLGFVIFITIGVGVISNLLLYEDEYCDTANYIKTTNSKDIITLHDGFQSNDSYFLGCASTGEKMYYCYYTDSENGYEYNQISPQDYNIYIKYCKQNEKPKIEENRNFSKSIIKRDSSSSFWFGLRFYFKTKHLKVGDIYKDEEIDPGFLVTKDEEPTYTIYIPEGSIVQDYKVDIE